MEVNELEKNQKGRSIIWEGCKSRTFVIGTKPCQFPQFWCLLYLFSFLFLSFRRHN